MDVVLDTNILHQEGLGSRNMLLLSRLCKSGKITVYIPEIVKREYLSRKISSAKEDLSVVAGRLDAIKKWIGADENLAIETGEIEKKFKMLHQNIEEAITNSFDKWVDDYFINLVEFEPDNIASVLDDYFLGSGAFRKQRHREDFPDAMICSSIKDILELSEKILVVVKDGNFKSHLQSLDGIETYTSLSAMFENQEVSKLRDELDSESVRIEEIKRILVSGEIKGRLQEYLSSKSSFLDSVYLDDDLDDLFVEQGLGVEFLSATIEGVDLETIENVEIGEVNFTDDSSFFMNVSFSGETNLNYVAHFSEYNDLSEERLINTDLTSMNGDGICELVERIRLRFYGYIEISIYDEMTPQEFKVHTQYLSSEDSPIGIEVSVSSVEMDEIA